MTGDLNHRFWKHVSKTEYCWEWTGHKNEKGYGVTKLKGIKERKAHRISLLLSDRLIPGKQLVTDHICRNRGCVRPDHLRLVPVGINSTENSFSPSALNKIKTMCKRGHFFSDENTKLRNVHRKGRSLKERLCKTCDKLRKR